jgi:hypothetical protein
MLMCQSHSVILFAVQHITSFWSTLGGGLDHLCGVGNRFSDEAQRQSVAQPLSAGCRVHAAEALCCLLLLLLMLVLLLSLLLLCAPLVVRPCSTRSHTSGPTV